MLAVAGGATALGALTGAALVSAATRRTRRGAQRDAAVGRALRRGTIVGCVAGLVAVLRVIDGLTAVTVVFVIAPFVVAEVILSARRAAPPR